MPTGQSIRKPRVERVVFECEVCGKTIYLAPSEARGRTLRFCSQGCAGVSKRNPENRIETHCDYCGSTFTRRTRRRGKHNYCSQQCGWAARRKTYVKWRDPEYVRAYHRKYAETHRERINQLNREWVLRNRQKRKESQRTYRENNRDQIIAQHEARRAQLSAGYLTGREWQQIKERYNYACLCCGRKEPEIDLHIDHVIPLALGGKHEAAKIQPLCRSCNCSKNKKIIDYRPANGNQIAGTALAGIQPTTENAAIEPCAAHEETNSSCAHTVAL